MGCGESKHAVATTDSFSSRKRQDCNSNNPMVQHEEVPYETKVANIVDKNNIIPSEAMNVVQKQETTEKPVEDHSLNNQGEEINTSVDDIKMDPVFQSQEKQENEDIHLPKVASSNKENEGHDRELSQDEYLSVNDEKNSQDELSPQQESIKMFASDEDEVQNKLIEGENDTNNKIILEENISPQHEAIEKEKEDNLIEGNNESNNESEFVENVSPQQESIEKLASNDEKLENNLNQGNNDSNESIEVFVSKEEEKIVDGTLENIDMVDEEEVNMEKNALVETETTPKAKQEDVITSMDERVDTTKD